MIPPSDRRPPPGLRLMALRPLLIGLFLLVLPALARAQNAPAVDKLIQMNKKALDEYGAADWDAAKRTLLQALVFAKKSGLDAHPMMARTYVHLGAVYVVGFKDRQKGAQSFGRAIEIDPNIHISKAMSTPELEDVFASSGGGGGKPAARGGEQPAVNTPASPPPGKKRKGPIMESDSGGDAPPPGDEDAAPRSKKRPPAEDDSVEPELPARIAALDCPVKDETEIDKPVTVRCAVAKNLGKVVEVVLLYLEPGKTAFTEVTLEKSPKGWYTGKIPKKAVTGTSLRFYIEGRNVDGKPIVANGSKDSPNLMLIHEAESAETEKELNGGKRKHEEENPLDEPNPNRPHRLLGHIDRSKIGVDTRYGNRTFWIGLGVGTGWGYAVSSNLEVRKELAGTYGSGVAQAGLFQLAPEIGFQINPDVAIAIEGRNEYINQDRHFAPYTASGANSVLLRLLLYTKQQRGRFYLSLAAGGGEGIRFVAYPADYPGNPYGDQDKKFKDTILAGPFLAGAGGGYNYEISKSVSFVAELNLLAGLPKFGIVGDLNLGFQVNFELEKKKDEEPKRELRSVRAPAGEENQEGGEAGGEGGAKPGASGGDAGGGDEFESPKPKAAAPKSAPVQQKDDE